MLILLDGGGYAVAVIEGPEAAVKAALPRAPSNFPAPPSTVKVPLKGPKP
jgi:hypothetical protein